jgi:hypothetical protein
MQRYVTSKQRYMLCDATYAHITIAIRSQFDIIRHDARSVRAFDKKLTGSLNIMPNGACRKSQLHDLTNRSRIAAESQLNVIALTLHVLVHMSLAKLQRNSIGNGP